MTLEIFLWVAGISSVPTISFCIFVYMALKSIKKDVEKLLEMHYNADEYGFGTDKQTKVIADNTRAMNSLTHYIKWLAEQQTGHTPPPHIEDVQ